MSTILKEAKRMWLVWLVLIVLLFFIGRGAASMFERWVALRGEVDRTEEQIVRTEESVRELEEALLAAEDPYQLEKEARSRFNLKREGEEVFVVVGLDEIYNEVARMPAVQEETEPLPVMVQNIVDWYQYFINGR